jgi:thiamine biosynthesis protein ThiI
MGFLKVIIVIIVRYGEIGLKSKVTRASFEGRLIKNIKAALGCDNVRRGYGRIYVESSSRKDASKVAKVFGVVSTSVAIEGGAELDDVLEKATAYAVKRIKKEDTFAVRARRIGKHDYSSLELAKQLGERIVKATGAKVKLTKPEVEIFVEVRDRKAYIFDELIKGVGGLPLGTQGRAVALISGGIDSPVAAWMMMRRGVDIVALFLDPRPLVDQRTRERALQGIRKLAAWKNGAIKTYIAPYGDVLIDLLKVKDYRLGCILCKRAIYRMGQLVAEKENCRAMITGESLGQVASQTMANLHVIDRVVMMPVFRPLIGYDKEEIISLAKKIGTYDVSILPANCCLGPPPHPETRASLERVEKAEEGLDIEKRVREMAERAEKLEIRVEDGSD